MNTPPAAIEFTPADFLARSISLFTRCKAPKPQRTILLRDYLRSVRTGKWQSSVEAVRNANKDSKADADRLKVTRLPVIKPSGVFSGLSEADLVTLSGILCIDLDDVGSAIEDARNRLKTHASVLAVHLSPRGTGLKVFMAIEAKDTSEHKACWQAAAASLDCVLPVGVKIDPQPSNVSSNCFVSYDPETWVSETPCKPIFPLPSYPPHTLGRGEGGRVISEESMSDCDEGEGRTASMSDSRAQTVCACAKPEDVVEPSPAYPRQVRAKAERTMVKLSPPLARIFKNYLVRKPVNRGQRYAFLLKVIPPLFTVVSIDVLAELLRLHHQRQTGTWSTPLDTHMQEVGTMLTDWEHTDYRQKQLNARELLVYDGLRRVRYRAAYRIMRDLAICAKGSVPFFMSCAELAARIGCHRDTAHETLRELRAEQVIAEVQKGVVWQTGMQPKATSFRWLLAPSVNEDKHDGLLRLRSL